VKQIACKLHQCFFIIIKFESSLKKEEKMEETDKAITKQNTKSGQFLSTAVTQVEAVSGGGGARKEHTQCIIVMEHDREKEYFVLNISKSLQTAFAANARLAEGHFLKEGTKLNIERFLNAERGLEDQQLSKGKSRIRKRSTFE
jgi:hypothetical protein